MGQFVEEARVGSLGSTFSPPLGTFGFPCHCRVALLCRSFKGEGSAINPFSPSLLLSGFYLSADTQKPLLIINRVTYPP
jgi:hypothetical protein